MGKHNQQSNQKKAGSASTTNTKKIAKPKKSNTPKPLPQQQQQESSHQIFISGIPYETQEQQLIDLFQDCGTIVNVKLPRYQDTGRCRGYAHIKFSNEDQVQEALKKDKVTLGTRYLTVARAAGEKPIQLSVEPPPIGCKTLFVKNLPYDATQEQIKKEFMHCGKIENIRMVYDSFHKHFKGFCYIDFRDPSSLKAGLKMNGKSYKGRRLIAQFSAGQARKGYKGYKRQE